MNFCQYETTLVMSGKEGVVSKTATSLKSVVCYVFHIFISTLYVIVTIIMYIIPNENRSRLKIASVHKIQGLQY